MKSKKKKKEKRVHIQYVREAKNRRNFVNEKKNIRRNVECVCFHHFMINPLVRSLSLPCCWIFHFCCAFAALSFFWIRLRTKGDTQIDNIFYNFFFSSMMKGPKSRNGFFRWALNLRSYTKYCCRSHQQILEIFHSASVPTKHT